MLNVNGSSTRFRIGLRYRAPLFPAGVHQQRPFCNNGGGAYRRRPDHRSNRTRSRRCGVQRATVARTDASSSADVAVIGGGAAGLAAAYFAAKQGAQVCARNPPIEHNCRPHMHSVLNTLITMAQNYVLVWSR